MEESNHSTSGIDTVEITMELARMKAQKHAFSYYDPEDIVQEIWISVNKAAKKFEQSRVKEGKRALSFFNTTSENALKNLKRDNKIADNVNLHDAPIYQIDYNLAGEMRAIELREYISKKLPGKLLPVFNQLVDYGDENIAQYTKTKLRNAVAKIVEEYYE